MELIHGNCLEEMKNIPDKSVDMILCDLPYGTTQNKWDSIIDLKLLWKESKIRHELKTPKSRKVSNGK